MFTGGVIFLNLTIASAPQWLAIEVIFSLSHCPKLSNKFKFVHRTVPRILTFSAMTLYALPPIILPKVITTGSKGSNFLVIDSCIPEIIFAAVHIASTPS